MLCSKDSLLRHMTPSPPLPEEKVSNRIGVFFFRWTAFKPEHGTPLDMLSVE